MTPHLIAASVNDPGVLFAHSLLIRGLSSSRNTSKDSGCLAKHVISGALKQCVSGAYLLVASIADKHKRTALQRIPVRIERCRGHRRYLQADQYHLARLLVALIAPFLDWQVWSEQIREVALIIDLADESCLGLRECDHIAMNAIVACSMC